MSTATHNQTGQSTCHRCGSAFPSEELRRAAVPSSAAVVAMGIFVADALSVVAPNAHVDVTSYCAECLHRVNFRRRVFIVAVFVGLPALGFLLHYMFG